MFEVSCALVILASGLAALLAFTITRDALHPAVFLSPLFGYFYGIWPIMLNWEQGLQLIVSREDLAKAGLLFFLAIAALYAGLLSGIRSGSNQRIAGQGFGGGLLSLPAGRADRLFKLAIVLGALAVVAYIIQIDNVGGFVRAYSRAKGGGRAGSGYIGEAVLLSFPSILILALSIRASGGKVRLVHIILALVIASPHLVQGTLGGRRGPLFLILATLLFSWFLARGRRPSLATMVVGVMILGTAMIVVQSQRRNIYFGSQAELDISRVYDADGIAVGREIDGGNSYFAAVAQVLASDFYRDFYWGYRYMVIFLVRPIPRQIWPTKYQDMGADWLEQERNDEQTGYFANVVNLSLPRGVSGGSIADGYKEFSWGVLGMFFVIGKAFALAYARHRRHGGFWTVLLMMMLALSVYLPSQTFSAWMHRLMFMGIFAYLFWRMFVGPVSPRVRRSDAKLLPAPSALVSK
jgi:oligosaccharide repeat unit polymerase